MIEKEVLNSIEFLSVVTRVKNLMNRVVYIYENKFRVLNGKIELIDTVEDEEIVQAEMEEEKEQ